MSFNPAWSKDETQYNLGRVLQSDCCGNFYVTDDDEREVEFWKIVFDEINNNFDKVVTQEAFGNKDECKAQNLMDMQHLLLFLKFIQREREIDAQISDTGLDKGNDYYIEEYCTKCIREKFLCKGYTIQTILKIFQLFELDDPSNGGAGTGTGSGSTPTSDGIGQMIIESEDDPIFRVT